MKQRIELLVLLFIMLLTNVCFADVSVHEYTRKDGTHVKAHHRSEPDGNSENNWSHIGNINPYTGEEGHNNTPTKIKPFVSPNSSDETNLINTMLKQQPSPQNDLKFTYVDENGIEYHGDEAIKKHNDFIKQQEFHMKNDLRLPSTVPINDEKIKPITLPVINNAIKSDDNSLKEKNLHKINNTSKKTVQELQDKSLKTDTTNPYWFFIIPLTIIITTYINYKINQRNKHS